MDAFDRILGHETPKRLFRAALARGRLAHAYLFEGPDGVGKKTFAFTVARSILCERPEDGIACESCRGCRRVDSRQHSDLILVERESGSRQLKVDAIRGLQRQLSLKAMEAGARVAILDDADRLGVAAGNSLLKVLEEPPDRTHLFLLTSNRPGVLTTLVSRCQVVRFPPLFVGEVQQVLEQRGQYPSEVLASAAALAEGSPGKALANLNHGWIELRDWILQDFLARTEHPLQRAARLVARLQEPVPGEKKKTASLEQQRQRLESVLRLLLTIFRDVRLAQAGLGPDRWLHGDRADRISRLADTCAPSWVERAPELAGEWLGALSGNVTPELIAERFALDFEGSSSAPL